MKLKPNDKIKIPTKCSTGYSHNSLNTETPGVGFSQFKIELNEDYFPQNDRIEFELEINGEKNKFYILKSEWLLLENPRMFRIYDKN